MLQTNTESQLIFDILMNMKDPDMVKTIADHPQNVTSDPFFSFAGTTWGDLSLTNGYPSLLLLFSTLEKQGGGDTAGLIAHNYVLKIKEAIESEGVFSLSLFGGVAGVCFALKEASYEGTRYQKMLNNLHAYLFDNMQSVYFEPLKNQHEHSSPIPSSLYDLVQGISGIGRYALENLALSPFEKMAETIAKALVTLSGPLFCEGKNIPGWFLSPDDVLNFRNRKTCLKGNFNLGLAHGVTGALAYLAIAWMRGIRVEGQKEAILRIAGWIRSKAILHNQAILWPNHVSWEEELEGQDLIIKGSKDAWCYGVPGIARTLFLVAKAVGSEDLKTFAIESFRGIFKRTEQQWCLPGPALCHGISGLLLITHEMSRETGCEDFIPKVGELKNLLLKMYQPEAPWGFKDVDTGRQGTFLLNKPGFLEGAAGVILTLLSITGAKSNWHLPLLIHE